jgi:hypothetical protein
MIYLPEIQSVVNDAYSAIGLIQFTSSVREPVSGNKGIFNEYYSLSTRIMANLEYINVMNLNISYTDNVDIEHIVEALKLLIDKAKKLCR